MPAFEDDELKPGEQMPENLRDDFLDKKDRIRQKQREEAATEGMLERDEEWTDPNSQSDG